MQFILSPAQVISRILAVLILAVPIVLINQAIASYEREVIATLSYQEIRNYLQEGQTAFTESYLIYAGILLAYLALVEAVAFVARLGMRLFRPLQSPQFARNWSH